ncbi:MAG: glucose-1-phosphate adenylyltransferase [Nitrospirota bacterium]|nr:MAG: glucose-1-phosphate adenylyltransferase [Nitrospirota bacterium]
MAHPKILAFILAGGKGERLFPLTVDRSKPAVPFGGRYRIVDFVLSNFINSDIFSIYLLIQYKSQSLIEHVRKNWVLSPVISNHFVALVPPQMRMGPEWFQGTADAVFQNINLIKNHKPELVAIFGADHIYRMDIRQMVDFHLSSDAVATVAAIPVPINEASSFGVIRADKKGKISGFDEKPDKPKHMAGRPDHALASMGNYIFNTDTLLEALSLAQKNKEHDFGKHILPNLVASDKLFAYDFSTNVIPSIKGYEEVGYWRDVGTIKAYFNAHRDMLGSRPKLEIENYQWPIHPSYSNNASVRILNGEIVNSHIAEGSVIKNARIVDSFIRRGVTIEDDVLIENSIIMDNTVIKKGVKIKDAIIDKWNVIKKDKRIGFNEKDDRFNIHIDESGLRVMPRGKRG